MEFGWSQKAFLAICGTFQLVQALVKSIVAHAYAWCLIVATICILAGSSSIFPFAFGLWRMSFAWSTWLYTYTIHHSLSKKSWHISVPLQTTIIMLMSTKHHYELLQSTPKASCKNKAPKPTKQNFQKHQYATSGSPFMPSVQLGRGIDTA